LSRAARVRIAVTQVAPVCRRVGSFTVRGHAGVNRIAFRGRLRGRPLPLGTYKLTAKARNRWVLGVTLVVAAARPSPGALARARVADACAAIAASTSGAAVPAAVRGPVGIPSDGGGSATDRTHAGSGSSLGKPQSSAASPRGQVLGADFSKSAGLDPTRVLLVVAAALAVLLLGLAALPETALAEPRLAALVETRRIELALAGATTLLAAVLVYLASG
jgi:hypothetical protein